MKEMTRALSWTVLEYSELSSREKLLFEGAQRARLNAQAPFSNYYVGAAVMAECGSIYLGCNVERASWTQTTHAEQNAIDTMVTWEGPAKINKLALLAAPKGVSINLPPEKTTEELKNFDQIPVPCGHCLQIIWENCHNDGSVEIFSLCPSGQIGKITIDNAFPLRFGPKDLGVDYSNLNR